MEAQRQYDQDIRTPEEEMDDQVKDKAHDEDDRAGTGRSYECVFCKRGFNTAQALGGHMNIHRKERARSNVHSSTRLPLLSQYSSSNTRNVHQHEDMYARSKLPPQLFVSHSPSSSSSSAQMSYRTFPSSLAAYRADNMIYQKPEENKSSPFGEDWWQVKMGEEVGGSYGVDGSDDQEKRGLIDELDLELRLGHDP